MVDSSRAVELEPLGTNSSLIAKSNFEAMDALMSGMMGMGMDEGSDDLFRPYNQVLARGYWYVIVFVVGVLLLVRIVDYTLHSLRSVESPSIVSQLYRLRF